MLALNPCLYREGSTICPLRNSVRNASKIQTTLVEMQRWGWSGESTLHLCPNILVRIFDQEVGSIGSIHILPSI